MRIRVCGADDARSYYRSQVAAIDRIEAIVRAEGIDCDFRRVDGYLVQAPGSVPVLVPTITASSGDGAREAMFAPAAFAARLTPGDTCLKARISKGRHGFRFVTAEPTSAGNGTGSFVIADANRARCLGNRRQ